MTTHLLELFAFGRRTSGGDNSTFRVKENGELGNELSVFQRCKQVDRNITNQYEYILKIKMNDNTYDSNGTSSTRDNHGITVLNLTDIHQTL